MQTDPSCWISTSVPRSLLALFTFCIHHAIILSACKFHVPPQRA